MARIEDLIQEITQPRLRDELVREVRRLKANKKFGLVFEEHLPETVRIPSLPVKEGDLVTFKAQSGNSFWLVGSCNGKKVELQREGGEERRNAARDEVVVVRRFGEPIYPALVSVDRVGRGGNKPWHTLIQADNYHALQLLLYTCEEQVDVIYIDPPYNTGARDWKYNNDFIDSNDAWRHSKWLAMMKRRLLLAKRLLKPEGVLIVTIDENEHASLGLLLAELFPDKEAACITIVHNPGGIQGNNFSYCHEYAYFVYPHGCRCINLQERSEDPDVRPLRNVSKGDHLGHTAANCFYPIFIKAGKIVGFGDVCADSFHPKSANVPRKDGVIEVYPIDAQGNERKWVFARQSVDSITNELSVEFNKRRGIWDIIRKKTRFPYKTVWTESRYNANLFGTQLLSKIIQNKFPFPKSLYAVRDCLQAVVHKKDNALFLDFFAGSGTTYHATALLNAEDGGRRRCILVTNNEVHEDLLKELEQEGLRAGDPKYEAQGICESVTWPRCKHATAGVGQRNAPLAGEYNAGRKLSDGFDENIEYFRLDFLDPHVVARGEAFEAVLPILWMMAGCRGHRETSRGSQSWFIPKNSPYAVLLKESHFMDFQEELHKRKDITHVFLVTDSEDSFRDMAAHLNGYQAMILYKSYLETFRINTAKTHED